MQLKLPSLPETHYRKNSTLLVSAEQDTAERVSGITSSSLPGVRYRRKSKLLLTAEQYKVVWELNYYFPHRVGYITEGRVSCWVRVQLLFPLCLGYITEGRIRCYFQLNNTQLSESTITTSSLPGVHYRKKCKFLLPAEQYTDEWECNYHFPNHVGYITEGRVRCYSQLNNTQPSESAIKTSLIARDTLQKEKYVASFSWTRQLREWVQLLLPHCLGYVTEGRVSCYFQLNNTKLCESSITISTMALDTFCLLYTSRCV